jgi:hypothetical protein
LVLSLYKNSLFDSLLAENSEVLKENYTPNEWRRCENYTPNEWRRCENCTRNEWRRCENYTRNEWRRCETTLETSGEDVLGAR